MTIKSNSLRPAMLSKEFYKIINNLLYTSNIIDEHNLFNKTKLNYYQIYIINVKITKNIRTAIINYYIKSKDFIDLEFFELNKRKIIKELWKKIKIKYFPKIKFKFNKNYEKIESLL